MPVQPIRVWRRAPAHVSSAPPEEQPVSDYSGRAAPSVFAQEKEERRLNAARGMGNTARDSDGSFGSEPLYDSFDDESEP